MKVWIKTISLSSSRKRIRLYYTNSAQKILALTFIQKILIDSEKMRSCILMKLLSAIHVLVSDSSNVIFLNIWIIVNFIRTHVQDHLQFSIVSNLLFKILQLYSCQYLLIFFTNILIWKLILQYYKQYYEIFVLPSLHSSLQGVRANCLRQCVWISEECPGVGYRRLGAGLSEYLDDVSI